MGGPSGGRGSAVGVDGPARRLSGSAVGDRAWVGRWRPCGRSSSEQWVAVARFRLLAWPAGFDMQRLLVPRALQKQINTYSPIYFYDYYYDDYDYYDNYHD